MSNEDWLDLTDQRNHTSQLLLFHFLIMDRIMGMMYAHESLPIAQSRRAIALIWMRNIASGLSSRYRKYLDWPLQFVESLSASKEWPLHIASRVSDADAGGGRPHSGIEMEDYLPIVTI